MHKNTKPLSNKRFLNFGMHIAYKNVAGKFFRKFKMKMIHFQSNDNNDL